jgi:hypothetical protein
VRRILLGAAAAVGLALLLAAAFGGVALVNYDTLYGLLWGRDVAAGRSPDLAVALAPTPHPLLGLAGLALAPLDDPAPVAAAAGYLALGALGVLVLAVGATFFGAGVGALAAAIVLTREPVLSAGLRGYVDIPYLCLLLAALLVEGRRPRAGAPVLVLLALAGLLRPEAWLFSAAYLAWLWHSGRRRLRDLAPLVALAAGAPLLWALHDLALTGDPLWSLTGTRGNAAVLGRVTGLDDVPITLSRRLGEILREPVLLGAAGGGVLALLWLRRRAAPLAAAGVLAVLAFCVLAAAGLSLLARYLLPAAAILAIFGAVGVLGWRMLPAGDRRRRPWLALAALTIALAVVLAPAQARRLDRLQAALARQETIVAELHGLVRARRCAPLVVPNRRPVPHLALWLDVAPRDVRVAAEEGLPRRGTYFLPASPEAAEDFILDRRDLDRSVPPAPPRWRRVARGEAWVVVARCDG